MNDLVFELYKKTKKLVKLSRECEKGCEHEDEPLFQEWENTIEILELANPDYKQRYESELGIRTEKERIAFEELKTSLSNIMFSFIDKYSGKENPDCLYPKTGYILVDALTECLSEAQYQVVRYHPLTRKQIDHICYQIGDWYIHMKSLLEGTQHNLGSQKEVLKNMICGVEAGR